jgi:hypothetical protein
LTVGRRVHAVLASVLATAASLESGVALAHSASRNWGYPPACCHGDPVTGDCGKIPASAVTPQAEGYVVILRPGDHKKVTHQNRYFVPYDVVFPSGDDSFHICLHPTEEDGNCFFAPRNAM